MADESELSDDDKSFMHFFERLTDKCQSLNKLVETKIAEALKAAPTLQSSQKNSSQSGSYLEEQNRMLLAELLQLKRGNELSIPEEPGVTKEKQPPAPAIKPKEQVPETVPQKIRAVWR